MGALLILVFKNIMQKGKLKRKHLFIIGILILIAIPWVVFIIAYKQEPKIPPKRQVVVIQPTIVLPTISTPQRQKGISDLKPGFATENEVIQDLGQPLRSGNTENYKVLSYGIALTKRENLVYLNNNMVEIIAEEIPIDNSLYTEYLKKENLKTPDATAYDNNYTAGFVWQVFAEKGIAFLANPMNGYTIKILYFKPVDKNSLFDSPIGKVFNLTKSPDRGMTKF